MLDVKFIRENPELVQSDAAKKGYDISIKDLAYLIKGIVGFEGEIVFNTDMPDGTPRKLLDVSKLKEMGWVYNTTLESGVKKTYENYKMKNKKRRQSKHTNMAGMTQLACFSQWSRSSKDWFRYMANS